MDVSRGEGETHERMVLRSSEIASRISGERVFMRRKSLKPGARTTIRMKERATVISPGSSLKRMNNPARARLSGHNGRREWRSERRGDS